MSPWTEIVHHSMIIVPLMVMMIIISSSSTSSSSPSCSFSADTKLFAIFFTLRVIKHVFRKDSLRVFTTRLRQPPPLSSLLQLSKMRKCNGTSWCEEGRNEGRSGQRELFSLVFIPERTVWERSWHPKETGGRTVGRLWGNTHSYFSWSSSRSRRKKRRGQWFSFAILFYRVWNVEENLLSWVAFANDSIECCVLVE